MDSVWCKVAIPFLGGRLCVLCPQFLCSTKSVVFFSVLRLRPDRLQVQRVFDLFHPRPPLCVSVHVVDVESAGNFGREPPHLRWCRWRLVFYISFDYLKSSKSHIRFFSWKWGVLNSRRKAVGYIAIMLYICAVIRGLWSGVNWDVSPRNTDGANGAAELITIFIVILTEKEFFRYRDMDLRRWRQERSTNWKSR